MANVSESFTATGAGAQIFVRNDDSFTYDVSGTFVGTVQLQRSKDGFASREIVTTATGAASGTVVSEAPDGAGYSYRFFCSAYTSGTIVAALTEAAGTLQEFSSPSGVVILELNEDGIDVNGTLDVSGASAFTGAATFSSTIGSSGNITVTNTAPSLVLADSTASAKDLTIAVDADKAQFRESAGAAGSLLVLDLANNRVGVATASPTVALDVTGAVLASSTITGTTITGSSLRTTGGVGTAASGTTAVEYGDGRTHQTVLTVSTTLPAIAGGADLGVGKLLYTLPAGAHIIESAYMSIAITQTQGNINADTPDVGLGTVIASGAVATLDGTATFENIITGQTAADCTGTATVKTAIPTAAVPLVIEAAGAKTIHLNVADGWAASGDAAALLAGTVVINWRTMA